MGVLIQGPWKKREEKVEPVSNDTDAPVTLEDASNEYPWYALSGPKGTKPAEHAAMLTSLKRIARLVKPTGRLSLPKDWFWDPKKIQALIDDLNRIGQEEEENPPPDECA